MSVLRDRCVVGSGAKEHKDAMNACKLVLCDHYTIDTLCRLFNMASGLYSIVAFEVRVLADSMHGFLVGQKQLFITTLF